jgi:hypothetical protein
VLFIKPFIHTMLISDFLTAGWQASFSYTALPGSIRCQGDRVTVPPPTPAPARREAPPRPPCHLPLRPSHCASPEFPHSRRRLRTAWSLGHSWPGVGIVTPVRDSGRGRSERRTAEGQHGRRAAAAAAAARSDRRLR